MQQDKYLYVSLGIGFLIVGLIFFYEDYGPLLGFSGAPSPSQQTMPLDLPPQTEPQTPVTTPSAPNTHTVGVNDDAYSIAVRYGLTVEELVLLNPTKVVETGSKGSDGKPVYNIQVGETLMVGKKKAPSPSASSPKNDVIMQASDYLATIESNCSEPYCPYKPSELQRYRKALQKVEGNSLANRILLDFERILTTYHSNGLRKDKYEMKKHRYKEGETVYDIASQYDVAPADIARYNLQHVTPVMSNGMPITDAEGKVKYNIEKGARLIYFQRIDQ